MLNECVSKWRETRVRLLVHTCDAPLRGERAGELTEPKKTAHSTRISPPFLAFVKVKRSAGFAGAEGAHLVPATSEQALGDGCKKSAGFAAKSLQVLQVLTGTLTRPCGSRPVKHTPSGRRARGSERDAETAACDGRWCVQVGLLRF